MIEFVTIGKIVFDGKIGSDNVICIAVAADITVGFRLQIHFIIL